MVVTDYAVVEAMRALGGAFIRALAIAFERADPFNAAKLKAAFPDEWQEYTELARWRQAQGQGPK